MINLQIKAPRVFLINENGEQVGVVDINTARKKAMEAEFDLVEVSPKSNPPVVKIIDFGQYKYETEKRMRKAKAHQKVSELKVIRLSFRIKGHDLEVKQKQALKFLDDGNKVKVNIVLRGREKAHKNIAVENMNSFIRSLGEAVKIVQPISQQGGQINATIGR